MNVADIMRRSFATIKPDAPVLDAAHLLLETNQRGLPVVDQEGTLVGIISEGDFVHRSELDIGAPTGNWLEELLGIEEDTPARRRMCASLVHEVMTRDPVCVDAESALDEVVALMDTRHIAQLPVVCGATVIGVLDEDVEYAVNRSSLDNHWSKVIVGNFISVLDNYADDAVLELPQSGRAITGREEIGKYRASRTGKVVAIDRIRGRSDLWVTEYLCSRERRLYNIISIMEYCDGRICRETEYSAERTAGAESPPSALRSPRRRGLEALEALRGRGSSRAFVRREAANPRRSKKLPLGAAALVITGWLVVLAIAFLSAR